MDFNPNNIHDNPFKVPEGYFDSIAQRVMDNLPAHEVKMIPAEEKTKRNHRIPIWVRYGVAAAVVAAIFTVGMRFTSHEQQAAPVAAVTMASYSSDDNIDAMADYIMVDSQDLYAYISDE